jgi:hypothetical protein
VQFQVIITPSAKTDIFEINDWWLKYYEHLADDRMLEIRKAVLSLAKFPEKCAISSESDAFDVVVR